MGSGQNAYLVHRTPAHARHRCRKVFRVEKYGLIPSIAAEMISAEVVKGTEIAPELTRDHKPADHDKDR
ncbi:MAG: hypothetical protein SYR96_24910 [Actinomycetota bacterium]|nr:hypothetical protein [Actinomycetota bacterium]